MIGPHHPPDPGGGGTDPEHARQSDSETAPHANNFSADYPAVARQDSTPRKFGAKSTAGEAQRQRILEALRIKPRTSYDLRRIGCYQCPTRIKELRAKGWNISTARVTLIDAEGYLHPRCALYSLFEATATASPERAAVGDSDACVEAI